MDILKRVFGLLVTVSIPILISVLVILFLLSPVFMGLEYRRPGFPEDSYGFSTQERLEYGNLTRKYLITKLPLDELRALRFEDGDAIYIERELGHLEDVKLVLQALVRTCYIALGVFLIGWGIANTWDWKEGFLQAIFRGGKVTAALLVLLILLTLVSFQALFTNFHRIFFEGDSWLFFYSDSLIRLFPIQFWQDIFLVFGILTLLGGVLLGWVIPARRRKSSAT